MDFKYEYENKAYTIKLEPQADHSYIAVIGEKEYRVELQANREGLLNLLIDGKLIQAYTARQKSSATTTHYIAVQSEEVQHYTFSTAQSSVRRHKSVAGEGSLKAQMPGQVTQIMVEEGQKVEKGQTLLTLEAMKMEIRVTAPSDGILKKLMVKLGDTVERGQQLAELTLE